MRYGVGCLVLTLAVAMASCSGNTNDDNHDCIEGETRAGSVPCGLNQRGVLQQVCLSGQWQDNSTCLDPDACTDGETRNGTTACGLNGRGALEQECLEGQWQDTSSCQDPDVCRDGEARNDTTPCGLNDRGLVAQECVAGQWQQGSCQDPDECVDGTSEESDVPCGPDAYFTQTCVLGSWEVDDECSGCIFGYQDNDNNGTCEPDCNTAGYTCSGHGVCDDSSGTAVCNCHTGYLPSGGECLEDPDTADWSVLVYMNADNDLEYFGYLNLYEMSDVGSSPAVNIICQFDSYSWDGGDTRRLRIEAGNISELDNLGEIDMSDWRSLRDFGAWAVQEYPARHYALILWDHGDGWRAGGTNPLLKGFSYDFHGSGWDMSISNGDLARALEGIADALGRPIDVLGFDACVMGMWEIAHAVAPHADYLVASSETEPGAGWVYPDFLEALKTTPGMDPASLGIAIADTYYKDSPGNYTMAVTRLDTLAELGQAVDNLAGAMLSHPELFSGYENVRDNTQGFYLEELRDLRHFAMGLGQLTNPPSELQAAADALITRLDASVIFNRAQDSYPDSYGLSVYLPPQGQGMDPAYLDAGASWSQDTRWDDFLISFSEMSGCAGECAQGNHTACTCHPSDPCGWSGNGRCDEQCRDIVRQMFDDEADCAVQAGCGGDCAASLHTYCTCDPSDPCGWSGNGHCDWQCLEVTGHMFDDGTDCSATGCDGECAQVKHTVCTCSPWDPCGWQNDGYCDYGCRDHTDVFFEDWADCVASGCNGDCDELNYSPCTCDNRDPCSWASDGYCDFGCVFHNPLMFDDADDCM